MKERGSGILLHISSLPSPYGIGDFGQSAYDFVDFLKETKTKYWQILPLGVTGYGDSPYQSFSAFAGNPYFINLDEFIELGYLTEEEVKECDFGRDPRRVDYARLYDQKMPLLYQAFCRAFPEIQGKLDAFVVTEEWLADFALFMALKDAHDGASWQDWQEGYKFRDPEALSTFREKADENIYFWIFTQYYFMKQWFELKEYANNAGVKIIGDIPIYIAEDSADLWAEPEMFQLNDNLVLKEMAGVPPDAFTDLGQLWGNPLYDWQYMKEDGYRWWIKRIRESLRLYDTVRIDHFRGFEAYWSVPAGSENAIRGRWQKGPGIDLFNAIHTALGEADILAEDLGIITDEVRELIAATGYSGMKMLVFGFDPYGDSEHLPHNYERNMVVYTSNHDSPTVVGQMNDCPELELEFAKAYLKIDEAEGIAHGFIRGAWASHAYLAIAPMQDLLGLGNEARFNLPATLGQNWQWRMESSDLSKDIRQALFEYNRIYRRS